MKPVVFLFIFLLICSVSIAKRESEMQTNSHGGGVENFGAQPISQEKEQVNSNSIFFYNDQEFVNSEIYLLIYFQNVANPCSKFSLENWNQQIQNPNQLDGLGNE